MMPFAMNVAATATGLSSTTDVVQVCSVFRVHDSV